MEPTTGIGPSSLLLLLLIGSICGHCQWIPAGAVLWQHLETVHGPMAGEQAKLLAQLPVLFVGGEIKRRLFRCPFIEVERIPVAMRWAAIRSDHITVQANVRLQ